MLELGHYLNTTKYINDIWKDNNIVGYSTTFWELYAKSICDMFEYEEAPYEDFVESVGGQRIVNNEIEDMTKNYVTIGYQTHIKLMDNVGPIYRELSDTIFLIVANWIRRRLKISLAELDRYEERYAAMSDTEDIVVYINIPTIEIPIEKVGSIEVFSIDNLKLPYRKVKVL